MAVDIVKPTPAHVVELGLLMRPEDAAECIAAGYASAMDAAAKSVEISPECWACVFDGELMGIFGITPESVLAGHASLWLLTTEVVSRKPKTFVKTARKCLAVLRSSWPKLSLDIDAHYGGAIRFAAASGFTVGAPHAHLLTGEPVRHAEMGA